jgi:hypothetical protein
LIEIRFHRLKQTAQDGDVHSDSDGYGNRDTYTYGHAEISAYTEVSSDSGAGHRFEGKTHCSLRACLYERAESRVAVGFTSGPMQQ